MAWRVSPRPNFQKCPSRVGTSPVVHALYFSRKALPFNRSKSNLKHYKHIGVYAFRKKALFSFSKLKKSVLEKAEMIEAIRFIENGIKIKILEVFNEYISIDTIEDLKKAKKILND